MEYKFIITGKDSFKGATAQLCPIEIMVMRDALNEYVCNADIHALDRKIAENMLQLMWEEEERLIG